MPVYLASRLIDATRLYEKGDDRGFVLYESTIEIIAKRGLADQVQTALISLGSEIVLTTNNPD